MQPAISELHAAAEQVRHLAFAIRDGAIANAEAFVSAQAAPECGKAHLASAHVLLGLIADIADGMHGHIESLAPTK